MKKKIIIVLLIIILLVCGIFLYYNYNLFNNNIVHVGDTNFNLPPDYYEGTTNEYGSINITNGSSTIFISEFNDTNVTKHLLEYTNFTKDQNKTITTKKYAIDDIVFYKTNSNNFSTVHYFFVKNNHTYDIYSWDNIKNMDSIVINLIKN